VLQPVNQLRAGNDSAIGSAELGLGGSVRPERRTHGYSMMAPEDHPFWVMGPIQDHPFWVINRRFGSIDD
jgi:hypothetical protein